MFLQKYFLNSSRSLFEFLNLQPSLYVCLKAESSSGAHCRILNYHTTLSGQPEQYSIEVCYIFTKSIVNLEIYIEQEVNLMFFILYC